MKQISGSIRLVNRPLIDQITALAQKQYDSFKWFTNPIKKWRALRTLKAQIAWAKDK